jgi:hypothetical protein
MVDANGREIKVGDRVEHAKPKGASHTLFEGSTVVTELLGAAVVVRKTSGSQIPVYVPEHLVVL